MEKAETETARTLVRLKDVSLRYDTLQSETTAVEKLNMEVREGEFVAIVGPSGCGKTTVLSLIMGLLQPSEGQVETMLTGRMGYMLQHDHLLEWRNVERNVLLGPEVQHSLNDRSRAFVDRLLKSYGLDAFRAHLPSQLSGGMRQKVALIRTLATDPQLLLLDEPFSALDFQTRLSISDEVYDIIRREGKTAVLVTHDISEAASMADRVLLMYGGEIVEDDAPSEVYLHPKTAFAADFIGASNVVEGVYRDGRIVDGAFALPVGAHAKIADGTAARALIKEENLALAPVGEGCVDATVTDKLFLGQSTRLTLNVNGRTLFALVPAREAAPRAVGETVGLRVVFASVFAL